MMRLLRVMHVVHFIGLLRFFTGTAAQPRFDHRTQLGLGTPPSEPALDEISGPFEIKVVARIDSISRKWQRLFEFGTQLNSDLNHAVSLVVGWGNPHLRFRVNDGRGYFQELYAHNVVETEVVTTWTVGVDDTFRMYIKKNGVEVSSRPDGQLPASVTRPIKYIGKSAQEAYDDLFGAVLGIQFVKGGSSNSSLPLEWMNYPGQLSGYGFAVSGYARFNDAAGGRYQRIFDFSDGTGSAIVNLGQRAWSRDMRLEVNNGGAHMFLDAEDVITDNEMAFWEAGVAIDGSAWIRKNGAVVANQSNFIMPSDVFRPAHRFGSSYNPADSPLNGVILGVRVDRE